MSAQNLTALVERLEKVTERLEKASFSSGAASSSSGSSDSAAAVEDAPFVVEYDNYVSEFVAPYLAVSDKIGGHVKEAAALHKTGFDRLRDFLSVASQAQKPSPADLQKLVTPINEACGKADEYSRKTRSEFQNHLQAVAAGMPALGWVLIEKTPAPYVNEMLASAEFYSNKVLVAYKGKDANHLDWAKAFKTTFVELAAYVKKYHTTGVSWNPKGKSASEVSAKSGSAPAPASGGAPPPPPPPAVLTNPSPASGGSKPPATALFAEINNKGDGVTTGLRHVTKDMKTKNQPKAEPLQPKSAPAPKAAPAAASGKKTGTPKFALDGNKWVVEYQVGNTSINIDETELKQTVYIYRCQGSVINVTGKVNAITFDECEKCGLVFENAVASCELVNCKSVEVQIKGKVPNVTLDKCSGVQLYLSKDCLDIDIVTSKSDAMNVLVPESDGDLTEMPIAEQFLTKYDAKSKKLVTKPNSHV